MKRDIVELYNVPSQRSGYEPGTFSDISGVRLRHGQGNQDASALARLGKSQELKVGIIPSPRCRANAKLRGDSDVSVSYLSLDLAVKAQETGYASSLADCAPGWLTALAWIATLAAGIVFVGTMIQGLIILNYPDSDARPYQGTLLSWSVILVAIIVNTLAAGLLPFLEGVILIIHTLGFVGVIVALLYLSDHVAASDVFFRPLNEGGWPTQGLSYCVGFIGNVGTFVAIGFLATASRMTWSFARDKALPFHRIIRQVDARTSVPVYAILVVTVIPCLLALIYIGSPVVYEDVVSMSVSGLYASYMIPCSLLLWRRVTGKMLPYDEIEYRNQPNRRPSVAASLAASTSRGDEVVDLPLMWGPWKLPGVLGTLNNALACVYCVFVLFWDFWPPDFPATPRTMNYAIVVTGGVVILSIVYYVLHGNREYKGPLVDREVALNSSAPPGPA
nr:putative amino-acid permease c15c4.04c [Quercus suber]